MKSQKEHLEAADIKRIVMNLQNLGIELKEEIYRLPSSVITEYLLLETLKIIELKTAQDFYYLQNKISRMIELVIRWDIGKEVLGMLEKMITEIDKIVRYIEK